MPAQPPEHTEWRLSKAVVVNPSPSHDHLVAQLEIKLERQEALAEELRTEVQRLQKRNSALADENYRLRKVNAHLREQTCFLREDRLRMQKRIGELREEMARISDEHSRVMMLAIRAMKRQTRSFPKPHSGEPEDRSEETLKE
jgi:predicted nuclease with TOPRIM domain